MGDFIIIWHIFHLKASFIRFFNPSETFESFVNLSKEKIISFSSKKLQWEISPWIFWKMRLDPLRQWHILFSHFASKIPTLKDWWKINTIQNNEHHILPYFMWIHNLLWRCHQSQQQHTEARHYFVLPSCYMSFLINFHIQINFLCEVKF